MYMKLWWIDMRNVRLCSCTLYTMKVQAFIPACCIGWPLFAATHWHRRKLKYNVKMVTVVARIPITIFMTAKKLDGAACAFEDNMIRLIPSSSMNLVILLKVSGKLTLLKFQKIEKVCWWNSTKPFPLISLLPHSSCKFGHCLTSRVATTSRGS